MAMALSGLLGSAIFRLRGVAGLSGWKWLFIIDGIITVIIAVMTWCVDGISVISSHVVLICCRFYLPKNAATTKGGLRGRKPWFDDRQVQISVTRVIRDDIAKKKYESVAS